MQLTYFCGSHVQCSNNTNQMVLQVAKYNLEHRYSVVGVMEHFNISIPVMEAFLPGIIEFRKWRELQLLSSAYFKGATAKMSSDAKEIKKNSNPHNEPSSSVRWLFQIIKKLYFSFSFFVTSLVQS